MSDDFEFEFEGDVTEDFEFDAYVMTLMLKEVNPDIDEGETFEILYEAMHKGIDEKLAKRVGKDIRATKDSKKAQGELH